VSNKKKLIVIVFLYIYLNNHRITKNISPASLKREFHGNYLSNKQTLHVLQWNILAQGIVI
jgi:hypothetical protein